MDITGRKTCQAGMKSTATSKLQWNKVKRTEIHAEVCSVTKRYVESGTPCVLICRIGLPPASNSYVLHRDNRYLFGFNISLPTNNLVRIPNLQDGKTAFFDYSYNVKHARIASSMHRACYAISWACISYIANVQHLSFLTSVLGLNVIIPQAESAIRTHFDMDTTNRIQLRHVVLLIVANYSGIRFLIIIKIMYIFGNRSS
jgi:hypothetical protein